MTMHNSKRRQSGYTLMEIMATLMVMAFVVLGSTQLLSFGARTYANTSTDADLTNTNVNGSRRVIESLRQAMSIDVKNSGLKVEFFLPLRANAVDPTTGEREIIDPMVPEISARAFEITGGKLIDVNTGRVLVRNIILTDPDPTSSQYGQPYAPFQVTTIGSRRALTINLITDRKTATGDRYVRMKTTVLVRNSQ